MKRHSLLVILLVVLLVACSGGGELSTPTPTAPRTGMDAIHQQEDVAGATPDCSKYARWLQCP